MQEEASRERKWLLQEVEGLLSFITYPILVVDRFGRVIHVNPAAEHIWRRSQVVLLNQTLQDLVESAKLLEWVGKGKPLRDFPVEMTDGSGKKSPYLCRLHPLFINRKAEGAILQFTEQILETEFEKNRKYVTRYTLEDVRGHSPGIMALKEQARKIAKSDSTVLIRGESGTGKEVLAQSIHQASSRSGGPFVAINCAAIPEALLESELFGYDDGAFTGAKKGGKPGRFELALNGTLFLDEIGDMPPYLQAKLLRVLQEKRIERVGGSESIPVDTRLIAATHKDLEAMIVSGQFREDLFYRLHVIPLYVPPLRERGEDLYDLIQYYMKSFGDRLGKEPKRFTTQAMKCLLEYHWPGNIRELENTLEYIVNLEIGDLVTINSLPSSIRTSQSNGEVQRAAAASAPAYPELSIEQTEEQLILQAVQRFGRSTEGKRKAAEYLGISVATLYRRLSKINRKHPLS
ncbi:sigma-54 interaction domain-containing protein [Brevibacillus choshinensis]|uniref:Sigma 54-interacting transcriptional regulator n=1 Tax=Brevibacillus choshinensis TaxID=54911 RepID=A0ABX7FWY7_BRECH|nr:sigma 54-interacting transcriptional regulator [Brevibacillus choshinensis]QRG70210.1 sigma 54-interacting transcriptional regulator [Brevibacillus choshinensis]